MPAHLTSTFVAFSGQIASGAVTEAKLAAEACSAAKMKKEGTATHVLTSNGAGAVPSYQALPSGVSQDLVKIETITLAGADAQTFAFTTIGAGYKSYYIVLDLIGATVASRAIYMQYNNDTTAGNYLGVCVNDTSLGANNSPTYVGTITNTTHTFGFIEVTNVGSPYKQTQKFNTISADHNIWGNGSYAGGALITEIRFSCDTDKFKIGSTATLWGLK